MATARKGVRNVKTMAALSDRRRTRTAAGALLEMSALANEKERLNQELLVAARRRAEIEARLRDITEKEGRLQGFIKNPALVASLAPAPTAVAPQQVKAKEIRY